MKCWTCISLHRTGVVLRKGREEWRRRQQQEELMCDWSAVTETHWTSGNEPSSGWSPGDCLVEYLNVFGLAMGVVSISRTNVEVKKDR